MELVKLLEQFPDKPAGNFLTTRAPPPMAPPNTTTASTACPNAHDSRAYEIVRSLAHYLLVNKL
jgi:hypothetical protein